MQISAMNLGSNPKTNFLTGGYSTRALRRSTSLVLTHPSHKVSQLPCRAPIRAAAAAAAPAAAPVLAHTANVWFRAGTGVPLVEAMRQFTFQEAAVRCAALIGVAIIGTVVGERILRWVNQLVEIRVQQSEVVSPNPLSKRVILGSALIALITPAQVLLPWACAAFGSTVLASFAEVALEHYTAYAHLQSSHWLQVCGHPILSLFHNLAQLLQDMTEIVVIVFIAWFILRWKNRVIESFLDSIKRNDPAKGEDLSRVVTPTNTLSSWGIITASIFSSLAIAGVDVRPLLALGSASTLAIGLAAQSTVTNMVSAFSLYTYRPFIQGDHIILKTASGGTVATGTVEKIMPMQTIIIQDNRQPVYVNNKDVANMVIINESKVFPSNKMADTIAGVDATLTVRYADLDKIPAIEKEATEYIKGHPDMLGSCRCILSGFDTRGPVLGIKFVVKKEAYSNRHWIKSEVLQEVERIVRKNGAELALEDNVRMVGGFDPNLN